MNREFKKSAIIAAAFIILALMGTLAVSEIIMEKQSPETGISQNAAPQSHGISELANIKPESGEAQNNAPETFNEENESEDEASASKELDEESSTVTVSVDGYNLANAVWPVSQKEITMAYSYNTLPVFSKTYNAYRSDHAGIDIAAKEGEEVRCAYKGKVVEITNDSRLGKTVKVQHAEDVFSIYANLAEDVSVTLNQSVNAGDVLGKVGSTASSEIAEDSHLHFGVQAFGDYVDPTEYVRF